MVDAIGSKAGALVPVAAGAMRRAQAPTRGCSRVAESAETIEPGRERRRRHPNRRRVHARFAVSAVVAACAGVAATVIPRARTHMHAPVLDEIGSAGPLADPAYAHEEF